jgi:hypothetical protein
MLFIISTTVLIRHLWQFKAVVFLHTCNSMEQRTLKNVNSCCKTNISFYSETSVGQNSNLYLNFVPFSNTSVN